MGAALLLAALLATPAPSPPLTGRLELRDGQRLLHLWGSPSERGFAHGYLLHAEILDVIGAYALPEIGRERYAAARALINATATVPAALRAEAEGVVAGLEAAGAAPLPALGRALDVRDILLMQAYTELAAVGCSSLALFAAGSADGETRLVRNLDWSAAPALLRNQAVFVYHPTGDETQAVLSVAFAGYLGCLSCVSAAGVGAFFNMGYGPGAARPWQLLRGFSPANLLLRAALARGDGDGDGAVDREDVVAALSAARHAGSYLVHAVDARAGVVIEVEADGVALRRPGEARDLPPTALAATNHLRQKHGPAACGRYARIQRALTAGRPLDAEAQWRLGAALALPEWVHTLQYTPARQRLRLRLRPPRPGPTPSPEWDLRPLWAPPAP